MKKKIIIILAAAILLLSGCSKNTSEGASVPSGVSSVSETSVFTGSDIRETTSAEQNTEETTTDGGKTKYELPVIPLN